MLSPSPPIGLPPEVDLREWLVRMRAKGVPFREAWQRALHLMAGTEEDREVAEGNEGAWRRAYDGEPATRGEEQASALFSWREHRYAGEPLVPSGPLCPHCKGPMPSRKASGPPPTYCSVRCRRDAAYKREREKAAA